MSKIDDWKKEKDYEENVLKIQNDLNKFYFSDNDWSHLHDCILEATWEGERKSCSFKELVNIYLGLSWELKGMAIAYGMNDSVFRDNFIEYYKDNYVSKN